MFIAPEQDHYWECWLNYIYETDKNLSSVERIKQCRKQYSCIWKIYRGEEERFIDYYNEILKNKYL